MKFLAAKFISNTLNMKNKYNGNPGLKTRLG
jgi:hypothetical protein